MFLVTWTGELSKFSASLLSRRSSRNGHTFIVGDQPRLSGVDEDSQTGTSFPEAGTSLEGMVMHHTGDLAFQISLRIMYPARASIVSLALDFGNLLRAVSPSWMNLSASFLA